MNIDERLGALAQSLELLAHMHQDDHERLAALQALAEKHEERFRQNEERLRHLEMLAENIVAVQETLARIVTNHDERLRRLEGQ